MATENISLYQFIIFQTLKLSVRILFKEIFSITLYRMNYLIICTALTMKRKTLILLFLLSIEKPFTYTCIEQIFFPQIDLLYMLIITEYLYQHIIIKIKCKFQVGFIVN